MPETQRKIQTTGRQRGRKLSPRQQALRAEHADSLRVPATPTDPRTWFSHVDEIWLEIGFGTGEHLLGQARAHPQVGIIGIEMFEDGAIKALDSQLEDALKNLHIFQGDARELLEILPNHSLDRLFILFPDPWPKARHHKRRLLNAEVLELILAKSKPGARLRFATDWADYANQALSLFDHHPRVTWQPHSADDWRTPPADHIPTRYQDKNLGDCAPVFFDMSLSGS